MSQRHKPGAAEPNIPLPDPEEVQQKLEAAIEKVKARKSFYTTLAIVLFAAAIGIIFLVNLPESTEQSKFVELQLRWDAARQKLRVDKSAHQELVELEGYLDELRGTDQEGHALWFLSIGHYREAWTPDKAGLEQRRPHLEKAKACLEELKGEKFDDLLLAKPHWYTSSSATPVDSMYKEVTSDLTWAESNARQPVAPDSSVVAVLRTSEGDVHLQFFREQAPGHVAAFLRLAKLGTYNETLFHFARKDLDGAPQGVMGGDPFTFFYPDPLKKDHLLRWGSGGVGHDLAPEKSRFAISHTRGIVTSQSRERADWDNGVQFMIVTGNSRDLDGRHSPFASVVEGVGIVDKIAMRKTAADHGPFKDDFAFNSAATRGLIVDPVKLHKVIVFENGKAAEHAFELDATEKSLATIAQGKVVPLPADKVDCGRRLRRLDADGDVRPGLDIPFPEGVDAKDADPLGGRAPKKAPVKDPEDDKESDDGEAPKKDGEEDGG